jgi:hypothetical protein
MAVVVVRNITLSTDDGDGNGRGQGAEAHLLAFFSLMRRSITLLPPSMHCEVRFWSISCEGNLLVEFIGQGLCELVG